MTVRSTVRNTIREMYSVAYNRSVEDWDHGYDNIKISTRPTSNIEWVPV